MSFTKVAPAGIGTEPGDGITIGDTFLHTTGIDIGHNTGVGVTIRKHGDATFTGIITASAFFGDGSGLEGVSSSGIGTPLSDDDTSELNKVYYVNQELSIGSTVTVNHPDSAVTSYTHYQDLVVKDNADFIVADGDTFIPDVLGIRTSTSTASAATGGRIRAGTITNAGANGAPNFPNGLTGTAGTFSGAINAASGTITGNLGVGGVLTYEDVTNVDSVGLITARSGIRCKGSLGIGTVVTSPSTILHLDSDGTPTTIKIVSDTESSIDFDDHGGSAKRYKIGTNISANEGQFEIRDITTGAERLRIGPSGQIGIAGANYGTSGQVLTSAGSGSAVQWATPSAGLSYAQQWLLTQNADTPANTDSVLPTTQGAWQKQSTATGGATAGSLGSDMSVSGGVFTFPVTGIWKIEFYGYWGISNGDSERLLRSRIQTTPNNSNYTTMSESANSIKSDSTYTYQGFFVTYIFDVSNTSTHKCRFVLNPEGSNCYYKANTNPPMTGALFMRLGDT